MAKRVYVKKDLGSLSECGLSAGKQASLAEEVFILLGGKFDVLLPVLKENETYKLYIKLVCKNCSAETFSRINNLRTKGSLKCRSCSALNLSPLERKLYKRFSAMKSRCESPNAEDYKYYGARGISLEFSSFREFSEYMLENFSEEEILNLEIDRVDNNGNYRKGNLRMVSHFENCQNTRRVKTVDYFGNQVPITHVWHLMRRDYPEWKFSNSFAVRLLYAGETPQSLLVRPNLGRHPADEEKLRPNETILALYETKQESAK
jgi:hypothetical protein